MEKLDVLLRDLAAQLGTTVEHLWVVLTQQAIFNSIEKLVLVLFTTVIGYFYTKHFKYVATNWNNYDDEKQSANGWFLLLVSVVFALLLCESFASIGEILAGFFNPEYYALKTVLELMSK